MVLHGVVHFFYFFFDMNSIDRRNNRPSGHVDDSPEASDAKLLDLLQQRIISDFVDDKMADVARNVDGNGHTARNESLVTWKTKKSRLAAMISDFYANPFGDFWNTPNAKSSTNKERTTRRQRLKKKVLSSIQSLPFKRNPETGTTLCSRTARENAWKLFDLTLPKGNAADAVNKKPIDRCYTHTFDTKSTLSPFSKLYPSMEAAYIQYWTNVYDVSVTSKSKYGHRSLLIRDEDTWIWSVLDPYRSVPWYAATSPKPAEEYFKHTKPIKMRWYSSTVWVYS
jgi:hypothetical protein